MKWTFHKTGYDYYATNESGNEHSIINISSVKWLRSLINWFISDIGFKYSITWNNVKYRATPTFGGYGYTLTDTLGNRVGKIKMHYNGTISIVTKWEKFQIKGDKSNHYLLTQGSQNIAHITTPNSILNSFPMQIDICIPKLNELPLLAFLGTLKCV